MQQYKPRRVDEWRHATPHAALTDASPKGRFCFVPAALLPVNGRMWMQNWHPGMHVNDSAGQSGPALNGIEFINPNGVALARRGVRNVTTSPDAEIPRILMQYAQSLPDRAHDIYQAGRAPIQWNDVADAATIAALQMPVGFDFGSGDVFPSSVSVAREVAAAFVEARAG